MSDERQRAGDRIALMICLKLFLVISSARSTVGEPYIPNVVDKSFEMENRIPCRLDCENSESSRQPHPSSTSTNKLLDPHLLVPIQGCDLCIDTLLVLPTHVSHPEFICKILEDAQLSPKYMQSRLDYTRRCILLESFRLKIVPTPLLSALTTSSLFTSTTKAQKSRVEFFRHLADMLSSPSLPAHNLYERLKNTAPSSMGMSIVVSINTSSREDVLGFDYPFSGRAPPTPPTASLTFPSLKHPRATFLLSARYMTSPCKLHDTLRSLIAIIPRPLDFKMPPFLVVAFRAWPLVLHQAPAVQRSHIRIRKLGLPYFAIPDRLLPTIQEVKPLPTIKVRPPLHAKTNQLGDEVFRSLYEFVELPSVSIEDSPYVLDPFTTDLDMLCPDTPPLSPLRTNMVFDIRRSSADSVTPASKRQYQSPRRSNDRSSTSSTKRVSSITFSSYTTDSSFQERFQSGLYDCLARHGYRLYVPGCSPEAFSGASLRSSSTRISLSSVNSITSITTTNAEIRSRLTASITDSASYYTALEYLGDAGARTANSTYTSHSTFTSTRASDYHDIHLNQYNHHYSHTHNINLTLHGDSYHGAVHGGIVGGRNNTNTMINQIDTLLSEIATILSDHASGVQEQDTTNQS